VNHQPVKLNAFDRIVNFVNPRAAIARVQARAAFSFLQQSGYIVAGSYKRSMREWHPSVAQSADQDILPILRECRASSRDLYANTPIATGALRRVSTNAIGSGLRLQSRIDREVLAVTDDEANAWEKKTEREFRMWAGKSWCDITKAQNFYSLQGLAFFNALLSGDVFALLPFINDPLSGCPYSLRVQIIEADFICNPNGAADTKLISGGVETDDYGAPIAYHLRKIIDPTFYTSDEYGTWERLLAFGKESGRRNVLHLFTKERPGQRRGLPMLAPVIEVLKQMSRLTEAELMAAVITAFFTVFVKTNPATGGLTPSFVPGETGVNASNDPRDANVYAMGNGNVIELDENQSIELADPKRPNGGFEPFFIALCKQVGSALEIPYEQLILHFDASYSAARGAILEAWKAYRNRRVWCASYFCQPIYEEFLTEAITLGRIVATGFFQDPLIKEAWCGSRWVGPGQGQINPYQETQAALLKIEGNLGTHEEEYTAITADGEWDGAVNRLAWENNLLTKKGLTIYTVKSPAAGSQGQTPSTPMHPPASGTDTPAPVPGDETLEE
jgi:lambda family phage portal protein